MPKSSPKDMDIGRVERLIDGRGLYENLFVYSRDDPKIRIPLTDADVFDRVRAPKKSWTAAASAPLYHLYTDCPKDVRHMFDKIRNRQDMAAITDRINGMLRTKYYDQSRGILLWPRLSFWPDWKYLIHNSLNMSTSCV
jgi:predicted AlkP superfamily pyrophosphatase or phosphodiesterase